MNKKVIMIDLDGVLNNYTKYEGNYIPEIREGAVEFLDNLYRLDKYELVLFTTRDKTLSEKWLKDNKINHYFLEVTNIKKPASIYIDDRALQFKGNFNQTLEEIEKFKVHWKK